MSRLYYKSNNQKDANDSPWSKKEMIMTRVWELTWNIFIRWTPKFMNSWHITLLKAFGAKIHGKPFIAPSCRIYAPWQLEIKHHACLAPRSEVYNLGPVIIEERATITQYTYLCNGTHDLNDKRLQLLIGTMHIGEDVFIGAKSIILPGLKLGKGSVIGAGSVLTKDTDEWKVYGGNPACYLKDRANIHAI